MSLFVFRCPFIVVQYYLHVVIFVHLYTVDLVWLTFS